MKRSGCSELWRPAVIAWLVLTSSLWCGAQTQPQPSSSEGNSTNAALGELQSEVHELKEMVQQLQQQTAASRAEIAHLREELQTPRQRRPQTSSTSNRPLILPPRTAQLEQRVDQLEER